jgi:hypothetical protein
MSYNAIHKVVYQVTLVYRVYSPLPMPMSLSFSANAAAPISRALLLLQQQHTEYQLHVLSGKYRIVVPLDAAMSQCGLLQQLHQLAVIL